MYKRYAPTKVASIALSIGVLLTIFTPGLAAHAAVTDVSVYDTADILDDERVADEVKELASDEDVHIAILTSDDPALTENNYDEDVKNLIGSGKYEDVQGDGGQVLKPDVVLISISPEIRKLGTYAGDDVSRADKIADKAVGEMKSPARDGDWDETAIAGSNASLKTLNGDYERQQKKEAEEFEQMMGKVGPFFLAALALFPLIYIGSKIIPRIYETISDYREEKRLLTWSPSAAEVSDAVRYWSSIRERLDRLRAKSPALRCVADDAADKYLLGPDQNLSLAIAMMNKTGAVPSWAKISRVTRSLIQQGFQEDAETFWSDNIQPCVDRVEAGTSDDQFHTAASDGKKSRKATMRFLKDYRKELDLGADTFRSVKSAADDLKATIVATREKVAQQEVAPWDGAARIDKARRSFESTVQHDLEGPIRKEMPEERRTAIADNGLFRNVNFLQTMLIYSAISHSYSHRSSRSSSTSSLTSTPNLTSTISTAGFSGGSGSF